MKRAIFALAAIVAISSPAAARQDASDQATFVLFTPGSDEVTNMGKAELDAFAREFGALKGKGVSISGHATLAESEGNSPSFAVGFSQRRANAVRNYLAERGVPHGVMITQAFGASRPIDGSRPNDARNQRVEVTVSEGSGW